VTYQAQWPNIEVGLLQVQWDSNKIVVMSLIALSLPDGIFCLVKNKLTVYAQWDTVMNTGL